MKQLLEDFKLLAKTDKRIWAGVGFILVVLLVWSLTDSWRPLPEVIEEKRVKVEIAPYSGAGPLLEGLHESLGSLSKHNENLKKDIDRVARNIETKQEEIEWDVDQLVSRLSTMSSTLDDITKKVGEREVEKYKVSQKLENRSRKSRDR